MARGTRRLSLVPIVLSFALAACAASGPPVFRTAPGDEDPTVLEDTHGHYAVAHGGDELPCEWIARVGSGGAGRTCVLNADLARPAPDAAVVPDGARALLVLRLEHFEAPFDDTSYALLRLDCPGDGRACRPDPQRIASWKSGRQGVHYRKALALSPDGHRVALLPGSSFVRTGGFAPPAPEGYHFSDQQAVGELVLVDLVTGAQRNTGVGVFDDQPISWSSDGRRLLFVRPETIDCLTPAMRDELRGREGNAGETIPVIETWDVATGAIEMLAIGFDPMWSPDQRSLIFAPVRVGQAAYYAGDDRTLRFDRTEAYALRDLRTGERRDLALPGLVGPRGPIAFVGPRQVLYWSLPRPGSAPAVTGHNSSLVGPKQMMTLKVGDLDSNAARTVEWSIDPRAQVGYSGR